MLQPAIAQQPSNAADTPASPVPGTIAPRMIQGAGSSFIYPIISQWIYIWDQNSTVNISYSPVGSKTGLELLQNAKSVVFAATEVPLSEENLKNLQMAQFPIALGGIVICVNLPGIASESLILDGKTLTGIYSGRITAWNDSAITRLNPDLDLPNRKITPVFRSDGSGTGWAFSRYLAKSDPAWEKQFGKGSATLPWPVGIGARGNVELSAYVSTIPYSLGYVEYAYAIENRLTVCSLTNPGGETIQPGLEAFGEAMNDVKWSDLNNFDLDLICRPGKKTWPITALSYVVMEQNPNDATSVHAVLSFFDWCLQHGADVTRDLHYVPLPEAAINRIRNYWSVHIQSDGKAIFR